MADALRSNLRDRLRPRWTEQRAARVRSAIERQRKRRPEVRRAVALIMSAVLAVGGTLLLRLARPSPVRTADPPTAVSTRAQARISRFEAVRVPEGEPVARPLTASTELLVDPDGAGRAFVLRSGSARFVVAHDENRPFRVRSGSLVVEDLGTVFTVTRVLDRAFDIDVEEGRVLLMCHDSRTELEGGQQRRIECPDAAPGSAERPPNAMVAMPAPVPPERRVTAPPAQSAAIRDELQELLTAADDTRQNGRPEEAVPYLQGILTRHGRDPRASLAAFTLGRLLLDELGRDAEAAQAFERARFPEGPLSEDALAREIEACARAGETVRAHALAVEYRKTYGRGRRAKMVEEFGGLR